VYVVGVWQRDFLGLWCVCLVRRVVAPGTHTIGQKNTLPNTDYAHKYITSNFSLARSTLPEDGSQSIRNILEFLIVFDFLNQRIMTAVYQHYLAVIFKLLCLRSEYSHHSIISTKHRSQTQIVRGSVWIKVYFFVISKFKVWFKNCIGSFEWILSFLLQ